MGVGDMYISPSTGDSTGSDPSQQSSVEPMLDFDQSVLNPSRTPISQGVHNTLLDNNPQIMKIVDKEPRKVTEIRVYYDDQTYETFVPMKSK
jgi:hypothetical protein